MRHRAHPLLHLDLQRWRMRVVMILLFGGFAALTARATYLQTWQNDFLNKEGGKRVNRVVEIPRRFTVDRYQWQHSQVDTTFPINRVQGIRQRRGFCKRTA